jgi:hypothetical protein
MNFPERLLAKIRSLAAGVKAAFDGVLKNVQGGFFDKVGAFFSELRERIRPFADRLLDKVPPERRKFVHIAAIGAFAVFLLFFSGVLLLSKGKSGGREVPVAVNTPSGIFIPADELFLPDEPDFVPGVLLERDRRPAWTADDAVPYWRDPLKNGEQIWRDQIEKTVDAILESVP